MTFHLVGQCPSGKNQIQLAVKQGKILKYPNATFIKWRKDAATQLLGAIKVEDKPLKGELAMTVVYKPGDRRARDVSGQLDALFHLLEYCGIVENDKQIVHVTWTRTWREPWPVGVEVKLEGL